MRFALWPLLAIPIACAQPPIDNVLVKMVPPGSTSLVGARMDEIRSTSFYKQMVERRKLPQIERFAQETGFDPRRDVRELLFASTASGGVLVARGTFRIHSDQLNTANLLRHGQYNIRTSGNSGFCILDSSLAAAGDLKTLEASLDEWTSGTHRAARPLQALAKPIDARSQFWGVSTGFAGFLAEHMPPAASGIDFSRIFRGLQDTWFQSNFRSGLNAEVHGTSATEQDAVNLRDTARGLIGLGRLSTPENQPELLKLWDGITAEQTGRSIVIRVDVPQDMAERLIQMLSSGQMAPSPGRAGRQQR